MYNLINRKASSQGNLVSKLWNKWVSLAPKILLSLVAFAMLVFLQQVLTSPEVLKTKAEESPVVWVSHTNNVGSQANSKVKVTATGNVEYKTEKFWCSFGGPASWSGENPGIVCGGNGGGNSVSGWMPATQGQEIDLSQAIGTKADGSCGSAQVDIKIRVDGKEFSPYWGVAWSTTSCETTPNKSISCTGLDLPATAVVGQTVTATVHGTTTGGATIGWYRVNFNADSAGNGIIKEGTSPTQINVYNQPGTYKVRGSVWERQGVGAQTSAQCEKTITVKAQNQPHLKCGANNTCELADIPSNIDGCTVVGQTCGAQETHLECGQNKTCIRVNGGGGNKDGCTAENQGCGGTQQHAAVCDLLTLSTQTGNAPLLVTAVLTGHAVNGTISTYTVDWGEGTPSQNSAGSGFTHTYNNNGPFIVNGTVTDNNGNVSPLNGNCSRVVCVGPNCAGTGGCTGNNCNNNDNSNSNSNSNYNYNYNYNSQSQSQSQSQEQKIVYRTAAATTYSVPPTKNMPSTGAETVLLPLFGTSGLLGWTIKKFLGKEVV